MKYPSPKSRLLFAWCCVVLMLGCLVAAVVDLRVSLPKASAGGLLGQVGLVFEALFLFGFAGFFLYLSVMLFRGPPASPPTEVKAMDRQAFVLMLFGTCFVNSLALRLVAVLRSGDYESYYGVLISCIVVSALAVLFSLGMTVAFWKVLFRKGPRLILSPTIPVVGGEFHGQLEVPVAADQAPEIIATLKMFHSVSDSVEFSSIAEVVWSQEVRITAFRAAGTRLSRGPFRFVLDGPMPIDFPRTGSFNWELTARSADPKRPCGGTFTVPIAFSDPVAEGIVAG